MQVRMEPSLDVGGDDQPPAGPVINRERGVSAFQRDRRATVDTAMLLRDSLTLMDQVRVGPRVRN